MNNNEIFGWFDFSGFYDLLVDECPDGGTIVELGSWRGKSTRYLAESIVKSGKSITVYAIDLWPSSYAGDECDSFSEFKKNLNGFNFVIPKIMDSSEASQLFEDGSCFAVFIDASHEYDYVLSDIKSWLPKASHIIAGHDYSYAHLGVKRAVDESFGDTFTLDNSVWIHRTK